MTSEEIAFGVALMELYGCKGVTHEAGDGVDTFTSEQPCGFVSFAQAHLDEVPECIVELTIKNRILAWLRVAP